MTMHAGKLAANEPISCDRGSNGAAEAAGLAAVVAMRVALPLLLGCMIYAAVRPGFLLLPAGLPLASPVARFLAFNLPDGLWMSAFASSIALIWHDRGRARTCWLFAALALALLHECGQRVGAVPGTFDPVDVALYVASWAAAVMTDASRRMKEAS